MVLRAIAAAEPPLHGVVRDRGQDLTARESELAEITIPLEHEGPDGTPPGCAIEHAATLCSRITCPVSHRTGLWTGARIGMADTPQDSAKPGVAACAGNELPEDSHLKRLAGPAVK